MKYSNLLFTIVIVLVLGINSWADTPQKEIKFLSGTDNENTEFWDFYCSSGRQSGYWTNIEVPGHWEQQGFGEYDYGRDYRTYGKKFKFANEYGIYKHKFLVDQQWAGKRIYIVFEGSMTDTEVKINGKLAGPIHQGAFYRFRYDITDKLEIGEENELEVTVHKNSTNHSVNRAERYADYWILGGIFRPVYLEAVPNGFIDRVAIAAEADGHFSMDVFPVGISKELTVVAEILDDEGEVVSTIKKNVLPKDSLITLNARLNQPRKWTSETPNLYSARVQLKFDEQVKYELIEKFGFRTIEIRKGDGVYVNGKKIKFKGINRHVFWPESGRCINKTIDENDVWLMKEMNMNAVRCSHYPPDQSFLDFCDAYGLYVLDELAGWQNAYDTEVGSKLVKEMVIRDVNHPSIVFWSNGNEGGTNKDLDDDFDLYDPSKRPVIHAHHKPGNDYNGIDCNHYEKYYSSQKILKDSLIYMPTEFLHGQDDGGMAASLDDFWELFWNSERSAGGFLWVLADEGLVRTDFDGFIDANRVNAPDGAVGPHREKEASVYAMREIFSPIKIKLDKLPAASKMKLPIENRFHFTNLKDCGFEWELINYTKPQDKEAGHWVMLDGQIESPNIAPEQKGEISFKLPEDFQKYDALYLTAFDPYGSEVFRWSWKIGGNTNTVLHLVDKELSTKEKEHLKMLKEQGVEEDNILPIRQQEGNSEINSNVEATENDSTITMKASGISVTFRKKDGTLSYVGNDFGLPIPFNNGPVLVSGDARLIDVRHQVNENSYLLEMFYSGDLKKVSWTMFNSGWLQMDYEYKVEGEQYFTGVSFNFPESDIISAKWLGDGPQHVWKNRLQGGTLDVYQRMYNNVLPGDNNWQYPQFKGYFADVSWMELNTVYGKFVVLAQEEDLFVRLFDFYGISGPKNYPQLPVGNISFLDGIPPVGTKLAMGISNDTWQLGPAGELNVMDKPVKRTLYFYFGLLN